MTSDIAATPEGAPRPSRLSRLARKLSAITLLAVALSFAGAQATTGAARPAGPLWHKTGPGLLAAARAAPGTQLPVIVRETAPASSSAEDLVRSLHGTVTRRLAIVGGFAAHIPANRLAALGRSASVRRVWGDGPIHMAGVNMRGYDPLPPDDSWRGTLGLPHGNDHGNDHGNGSSSGNGPTGALLDNRVSRLPDLP